MFKKVSLMLLVGVVGLSTIQSCSKDKTALPSAVVCDSTKTYTYTTDVKPIFDANCTDIGCHNTIIPASGVVLDNYIEAKQATQGGKVICVIKHECSPVMPQNAAKLSAEEIQAVECWADGGYQN